MAKTDFLFQGKSTTRKQTKLNQKLFPRHLRTLAKHQLDEFTVNESEAHGLDFPLKAARRKQEGVDFTEQLAVPAPLPAEPESGLAQSLSGTSLPWAPLTFLI